MSTLTKVALGLMGKMRPLPAIGDGPQTIVLPAPETTGGMPLLDALRQRQSRREFLQEVLPPQVLSNLLWAGFGINRKSDTGRTAPSAMNAQEIDLYAAMPSGLYLYDPHAHVLRMTGAEDVRRVTGYQDFVDDAPLDLIYMVPAAQRQSYASVAAGAIAQNIYLYCASAGLATVIRAWIDRDALAKAMALTPDHQLLLSQTVGYPAALSGGTPPS
ncbi:MAG: SagB/ThcOx family dehydrogenase [Betaproteobacteria bacterium]|nr:SagB/ThcOx family dehydrogenase [Betaproteobacteria bacterium]